MKPVMYFKNVDVEMVPDYGKQSIPMLRLTNRDTGSQMFLPVSMTQSQRLARWFKTSESAAEKREGSGK